MVFLPFFFLPVHFKEEPIGENRRLLRKKMPLNLEEFYDYKSRDEFFKQGVFFRFSGDLLREIELSGDDETAYLCFSPERENTVFRLNRFVVVPGSGSFS